MQRAHLWIAQKTHKNTISILLKIKSFTEILHKSSWLCSREKYAQKSNLTKVHAACTPVNWSKDSQKHDLDRLADKKFYWDSSQVTLAMQSGKLRSKVSNDQCAHSGHTCELAKGFSKIDLYINEERMYDIGISGGDYDED